MNVELVINSTPNEVVIGLLNDKRLIELHKEKNNIKFSIFLNVNFVLFMVFISVYRHFDIF